MSSAKHHPNSADVMATYCRALHCTYVRESKVKTFFLRVARHSHRRFAYIHTIRRGKQEIILCYINCIVTSFPERGWPCSQCKTRFDTFVLVRFTAQPVQLGVFERPNVFMITKLWRAYREHNMYRGMETTAATATATATTEKEK